MIQPPALRSGDRVGILATARRIRPKDIEQAQAILASWGLRVVLSPYLFSQDHSYLAGTDDQRHAALQQFIDDPEIKAILCARGGYGTTRILDTINFEQLLRKPKWVVGFSDVTALHLRLSALGVQSIHGTMPILFAKAEAAPSVESLRQVLFGQPVTMTAQTSPLNRPGTGKGILVGGNLSLIVDSLGTKFEIETEGKILILEEVDEYLYRLDRMMVQLKRSGKLTNLAGIAVGHFTEIKDTELSFGENFQNIILNHIRDYDYPVAFNFPTGHTDPNLAWISGGDAQLDVSNAGAILTPSLSGPG